MRQREIELLKMLDEISARQERITVEAFAARAGFANRSALARYPTLRTALSTYCARSRGRSRPAIRADKREAEAAHYRDAEIENLESTVAKLHGEVLSLSEKLSQERAARASAESVASGLRGVVSGIAALITQRSVVRAPEIEAELLKLAIAYGATVGHPTTDDPASSIENVTSVGTMPALDPGTDAVSDQPGTRDHGHLALVPGGVTETDGPREADRIGPARQRSSKRAPRP